MKIVHFTKIGKSSIEKNSFPRVAFASTYCDLFVATFRNVVGSYCHVHVTLCIASSKDVRIIVLKKKSNYMYVSINY